MESDHKPLRPQGTRQKSYRPRPARGCNIRPRVLFGLDYQPFQVNRHTAVWDGRWFKCLRGNPALAGGIGDDLVFRYTPNDAIVWGYPAMVVRQYLPLRVARRRFQSHYAQAAAVDEAFDASERSRIQSATFVKSLVRSNSWPSGPVCSPQIHACTLFGPRMSSSMSVLPICHST